MQLHISFAFILLHIPATHNSSLQLGTVDVEIKVPLLRTQS